MTGPRRNIDQLQRFALLSDLSPARIDLGRIVSASAGLLRLTIPPTVNLQVAIAPGLEPVRADEMAAHQILISLIRGSAGAVGPGGTLRVSLELVDVPARSSNPELPEGRYLCLGVQALGARRAAGGIPWGFDLEAVKSILQHHGGGVLTDERPDGARMIRCLFPVYPPPDESPPSVA